MKKLTSCVKKYYYVLAPFLIALYTVLFLYTQNQHEYLLPVLVIPSAVAIIWAGIVLFVSKIILKRIDQAVFFSFVVTLITLSFGRFVDSFKDMSFKIGVFNITPDLWLGVGLLVIFCVLFLAIFKTRKSFIMLDKAFVVISLFLVLIQVYLISSFEFSSGRVKRDVSTDTKIEVNTAKKVTTPDIYYFIFDRYAGPTSTSEQYGFDNSDIYDYLEEKGFYVSPASRSNYPKTFLSLGSSLNMKYLDELTEKTNGGASKDESLTTPLIENSEVLKILKDKGYSYVHLGSWWEQTKKNKNADYSYAPVFKEYLGADEFTTGFLNMTAASSIVKLVLKNPLNVSVDPNNNIHRQAAVYQFEALEEINAIPSPKFVFVHVLLPHDPFVFDKECNPITEKQVKQNSHQVNYINQLQCVNTHIKIIMDRLTASSNPPIILLQSDEGPFPMNSYVDSNQSWGSASDTALREKFPILNAYFFPEQNYEITQLYESISPVNSFKVLFNTYFGTDYELLEDKSYVFEDENNYYKFTDVTEIVK